MASTSYAPAPLDDRSLPSGGEDNRSSSEAAPTRAKRAQVKNACINCQKACKKCDSGRPCQRCVKYKLEDSCVDSKRRPRKKGVKRGPYKKRKKNTTAASVGSDRDEQQQAQEDVVQPVVTGSASSSANISSGWHTPILRASSQRRSRLSRTMERGRPPQILGPGAIPILHTDPIQDEDTGEESSSDVPLVVQHGITSPLTPTGPGVLPEQPPMHGVPPETPTSGLATAFQSLATTRSHMAPYATHYAGPALPMQPGSARAAEQFGYRL